MRTYGQRLQSTDKKAWVAHRQEEEKKKGQEKNK
jgi:hypothetical protein